MRKEINFYVFIIVLTSNISLFSQTRFDQIIINTTGEKCFQYDLYENKKSDTLNYYFIFENDYLKDSITIYQNDEIVFNGNISTNQVLGLAKVVKIGVVRNTNNFGFKINDSSLFILYPVKNKFYIRVQYNNALKKLIICYSKYKPYYE